MPQGIVDQLESVQVDHDETDRTGRALVDPLHLFFEVGPVIQAGQCIVEILVLQQFFSLFAVVDFPLRFPVQKGVFVSNGSQVGDLVEHLHIVGGKVPTGLCMP